MGKVGTLRRARAGAVCGREHHSGWRSSQVRCAGAAKVEPEFIDGATNQGKDCADNVGEGQTWTQLKVDIDPLTDGVYSDGTLSVTISNAQNDKTFDWSSNIGVDAVSSRADPTGRTSTATTRRASRRATPGYQPWRERDQPCRTSVTTSRRPAR